MDGNGEKPRGGNKAARPAPAQQQPAARAAVETPAALSDDDADATAQQVDDGQPDVPSVDESRGGAGGAEDAEDNRDDDDDEEEEQVERFYALLASIRAMRGLLPLHSNYTVASSSCVAQVGGDTDTDAAADSARTNKRLRRTAEPPWRPAFRMEDFEEPPPTAAASSSCKMTKRTSAAGHDDHCGESSGGSARPPVAVVASSTTMPQPHAAVPVRFRQSDSRSCSGD